MTKIELEERLQELRKRWVEVPEQRKITEIRARIYKMLLKKKEHTLF